jgi:uncharacterized delta-60 repeat protein
VAWQKNVDGLFLAGLEMRTDLAGEIVCCGRIKQKERTMKKSTLLTITGLLAIGLMFGVNFAQAQTIGHPGSLDPTFGTDGMATISFGDGLGALDAFEQSNGDIVVIAQTNFVNDFGTGIGLVRFTSVGVLDRTFGTNGTTVTTFPDLTFDPFGFAVQTNGDILVGGIVGNSSGQTEFGLARYTSNGVLDTTFGTGGLVTTQVGTRPDAPSAMLLQPNGQIVMGGFEDGPGRNVPGMMSMVRYNSNGSLDTTFGTGGISLVMPVLLGPETLALLSNGDYLAVGENGNGTAGVVAEFSSTGVLQSTVTPGTLVASLSSSQGGTSPTIFQPNGDYITAWTTATLHDLRTFANVARFSETGTQDSSFSSFAFQFSGESKSSPTAIALQANGQVVVGGAVNDASPIFGGLARLNSDGDLDTTFGSGGSLTTDNSVSGLLIQTDGKIVAVEQLGSTGIVVARYLAN